MKRSLLMCLSLAGVLLFGGAAEAKSRSASPARSLAPMPHSAPN
jgi:hypothetical protein